MLCENCKKNMATVYLKQIINGEVTELHLCTECASKVNNNISFDNIFKVFLDGFCDNEYTGKVSRGNGTCPHCGYSFEDFKNSGKFGCVDCYKAFKEQILSVLKNIHGSNIHTGKIPQRACAELSVKRKIESLKQLLKAAVEREEFEEAVKIRDEIRSLEGGKEA